MTAVVNTSPVILLSKAGQLDLLSGLYNEVTIPAAVAMELRAKPALMSQELEKQKPSLWRLRFLRSWSSWMTRKADALPAGSISL